jgi:hypothetical protein
MGPRSTAAVVYLGALSAPEREQASRAAKGSSAAKVTERIVVVVSTAHQRPTPAIRSTETNRHPRLTFEVDQVLRRRRPAAAQPFSRRRVWSGMNLKSLALALAVVFPSLSFAGAGHACRADAQRLCPNLAKGPERKACMQAHRAELSPTCVQAIEAKRAAHQGRAPRT